MSDEDIVIARACGKSFMQAVERMYSIFTHMVLNCPNKRVVHLAIHSKKLRVRKKNWKRIAKYIRNGETSCDVKE